MILDDLVNDALDEKKSLAQLLRRCLVLANQLRNEQLKTWANQELEGYSSSKGLPDYRVVPASAVGDFSGFGGSRIRDYPIPPSVLESEHRWRATKVSLMQSVSAYEAAIRDCKGAVYFEWPGDMVLYYQARLLPDYYLVSAKQQIPSSTLVEVLNAVRTRTLNLTLGIQNELAGSSGDIGSIPQPNVQKIVFHNIYGGNNIIGSDYSSISILPNLSGNRNQLNEELRKAGLSDNELDDLTGALDGDGGKNLGQRVQQWITAVAPKIAINGLKYGSDVAKPFVTELLKRFLEGPHQH
jgi:hypothetical protein